MPSRADRIDQSELASIFDYTGFATLVNFKTQANLVENLSATLRHSWNGSLFAEMDPTTATGAIFGIQGPNHLFTTAQVDSMRRTFRELLAGGDAMIGIYPVERSRWASYVGILTGMEIPLKVKRLLESAKKEYTEHRDVVEERRKSKSAGLRFDLDPSKRRSTTDKSATDAEGSRASGGAASPLPVRGSQPQREFERVMSLIQGLRGETFSLDEFISYIRGELSITDDQLILSSIIELQDKGYLAEIERNKYKVI